MVIETKKFGWFLSLRQFWHWSLHLRFFEMICNEIVYIHSSSTHKFPCSSRTLHRKLLCPFSELILSHHYVRSTSWGIKVLRWLVPLVRIIVINNPLCRLKLITNSLLLRLQTIHLIFFFDHKINLAMMPRFLIFFLWPLPLYASIMVDILLLIQHLHGPIL